VRGRAAASEPGRLVSILVDSGATILNAVLVNGGEVGQPIDLDAPEITARFLDPDGNAIGLYQEPVVSQPG
jgi:predicted enzyme related to lactoylglutathione lyase